MVILSTSSFKISTSNSSSNATTRCTVSKNRPKIVNQACFVLNFCLVYSECSRTFFFTCLSISDKRLLRWRSTSNLL